MKCEKYKYLMAKSDRDNIELWLPLWMHLYDTAGIMKLLMNKWIPQSTVKASGMDYDQFTCIAVFLAGIHDIGKATSYFQAMIAKKTNEKFYEINSEGFQLLHRYLHHGKTYHPYAGEWILKDDFKIDDSVAEIVGAHHGKPLYDTTDMICQYPKNFFGTETDGNGKEIWHDAWLELLLRAMHYADIETIEEIPKVTTETQVLLSGILIIADWVASNTTYFPLIDIDDCGEETLYPRRIHDAWAKIDLPDIWSANTNQMDDNCFKDRFGFMPNEMQQSVIKVINGCISPGVFIIEAQMGSGKTEAALASAEILASKKQSGGIFFGLPTQATSNGLFPRLVDWAKNVSQDTENAIQLAHGAANYNEEFNKMKFQGKSFVDDIDALNDDIGLEVHPWFQGNKKALLADFVLGTVDQFLLATLKRKFFMLRHVGLAGKVVIIDECHAYDTYMNKYLDRSISWMASYGVPVILLSATLPDKRRVELMRSYVKSYLGKYKGKKQSQLIEETNLEKSKAYPLITWSDGEMIHQKEIKQKIDNKIIQVSSIGSVDAMIKMLEQKLNDGGCACIIANTVQAAQAIYCEIKKSMHDVKTCLYHAQYTMFDRAKKEKDLLGHMGKKSTNAERDKYILIGTQVLEQSLDYDADIMFTQLCPIDLFLQRIGRLHRHNDRKRPKQMLKPDCVILRDGEAAYDNGTKAVYGEYLLLRTQKVLSDKICIPKDIVPLVQYVYSNSDLGLDEEEYLDAKNNFNMMLDDKSERAKRYLLGKSSIPFRKLLLNEEESCEKMAEASVRDGTSSIEVIVMKLGEEGGIHFISNYSQHPSLSANMMPNDLEGRLIAGQRLRLPHCLCQRWNEGQTIKELENMNRRNLSEWQKSPWLKGELILLFDENNNAELAGYKLTYDFEFGLQCDMKEDNNARKRI